MIDVGVAERPPLLQRKSLSPFGAIAPMNTKLPGLFPRPHPYAVPEFGPMPINTAAAMHVASH